MTPRFPTPPSAESVVAKALEIGVFAPVGFLEAVRSELPKLADRGRQTVEQRVLVGRFIATLLAQQARQRLEATMKSASGATRPSTPTDTRPASTAADDDHTDQDSGRTQPDSAVTTKPSAKSSAKPPAKKSAKPTVKKSAKPSVKSSATSSATAASQLAIDHYESLSATQVIPLLAELSSEELAAIYEFEQAHRNRRTVLGRIDQLRSR